MPGIEPSLPPVTGAPVPMVQLLRLQLNLLLRRVDPIRRDTYFFSRLAKTAVFQFDSIRSNAIPNTYATPMRIESKPKRPSSFLWLW